jgi:hypothetical protein
MRVFTNAGEQRWLPLELGSQRFDRAQSFGADVMLHTLHIVVDHLIVQPEELKKVGEQLMPAGDILRQRLASGREHKAAVFLVL